MNVVRGRRTELASQFPHIQAAAAGDIAGTPSENGVPPNRQANSPGDIQYNYDRLTELLGSFDPTWGAFKNIIFPAPGNQEW